VRILFAICIWRCWITELEDFEAKLVSKIDAQFETL